MGGLVHGFDTAQLTGHQVVLPACLAVFESEFHAGRDWMLILLVDMLVGELI